MSEEQSARNRALFPETARFVDDMRAAFGPAVALEFVEENGRTIGKPGPAGVQPVIEKPRKGDGFGG